jgi:hypothetical protein
MLTTITPSSVAAGTSMTSYPTPVRTTTLSPSSALITPRVTGADETTSASASRVRAIISSSVLNGGSKTMRAGIRLSAVWQSVKSHRVLPRTT